MAALNCVRKDINPRSEKKLQIEWEEPEGCMAYLDLLFQMEMQESGLWSPLAASFLYHQGAVNVS